MQRRYFSPATFTHQFKLDEVLNQDLIVATIGDAFFPEIDQSQWQEISRQDYSKDFKNLYDYSFVVYSRK